MTAIAFDSAEQNFVGDGDTVVSVSHTVAENNECDVIFAGAFAGVPTDNVISSVTDNGVTLTPLVTDKLVNNTAYNLYVVSPAPVGTTDVVANGTDSGGTNGVAVHVLTYKNCGGVDVTSSNTATAVGSLSDTFSTTLANDVVVALGGDAYLQTDTWGGTNRLNDSSLNNSLFDDKLIVSPGSVMTSYLSSGPNDTPYAIISVALKHN